MTRYLTAATLTLCLTAAVPALGQSVGIATSNPGGLFYNIGTAVATAANAEGLTMTVQPATSSNQYIPFVNDNGTEFGVSNLQEIEYALDGAEWWDGKAYPNLRIVAFLQPLAEAIFVRKDSGITDISQLRGRRVADGYIAQQTLLPQLSAIYANAGMSRDDVEQVPVASIVAGVDGFLAGDLDAFLMADGAGKVREADAAVGGLRALAVEDPSDAGLAKAREFWPTAEFVTLRAGSMPGVLEDSVHVAFPQVIFTNKDVPDDVVYLLAKAMYEKADLMGATFRAMKAFKPMDMHGRTIAAQFHPGALKFYKEAGLD